MKCRALILLIMVSMAMDSRIQVKKILLKLKEINLY
jgi:hypothetical protein